MHKHDDRAHWSPERQTRPDADLAALQRAGVEREWRRVWDLPIPFFRAKYEKAGLSAREVPPLDLIPRTIKDELRADEAANAPWGTWRSTPLEKSTLVSASGGTTGRPMLYLRTEKDGAQVVEALGRTWWRAGLRPFGRITNSWPGGIYGAGGQALAPGAFPAMEIPVGMPFTVDAAVEHLRIWQVMKPTAFITTGSQIQIYEQAADKLGIDLADIYRGASMLLIEASCQFEGPRKRYEQRYGVRVHNISGTSELPGSPTSDCLHHLGFHVNGDMVIAQVCDPVTGRELPEGGRGHLVWSSIGADSFWLRYDVEDWVERSSGPCPCGETGLRYRYLGRAGEMVRVAGRQIFPLDVQLALDAHGAPEFSFAAPGREADALQIKLETADAPARWADLLKAALGVPVAVEAVPVQSLPRSVFKPRRA